MRRPWPILWRWVVQSLLFCIPVALLVAWAIDARRGDLMREAQHSADMLAEAYARELGLLAADSGDLLQALEHLLPESLFREGCRDGAALGLERSARRYGNLLLVNAQGDLVCAAVPGSPGGQNFADRAWFRRTVEAGGLQISAPIVGRLTGRPIIVLSRPVPDPGGGPPRVAALTLDLLTLSASLNRTTLPPDTVISLVNESQVVLARSLSPEDWIGERVELPAYPQEVMTSVVEEHAGLDGVRRLFAAERVEGAPWMVFVGLPVANVMATMRADLQRTAFVVGATAIMVVLLAVWMSVSVGNPVRSLAAAVRSIREQGGQLGTQLRGPREVHEVALEFDRLLQAQAETLREVERSERRYRAAFEQAPVGIVHQDANGRYLRVNRYFARMLGHEPDRLLGRHDHELTHPEDRVASGAIYRRLLAGDITLGNLQKRFLHADGSEVWSDITVSRVEGSGEDAQFITVVEDVTRAREAEARQALAATVFECSAEGIVIADARRRVRAINPAFTRLTGLGESDIVGKPPEKLRTSEHAADFYDSIWAEVEHAGRWRGEAWLPRAGGGRFPALVTVTAVPGELGRPSSYVAVFADISREKQNEAELDFLVHHDALTQLPNRRLFHARLEHTIQQAYRNPEAHFSLLFIDLDDFKVVNDSLGHEAGDRLLVEFAQRLLRSVRGEDTVARMGGDEFMVLLEGAGTFNEISGVINKLVEAAQQPFHVEGHEVFVSASIGVAIFPLDAQDGATLVRNADVAMYRAKDKGKNRFEFYEASMSARAMERLSLANDMRRALDLGQYYLVYQPKLLAADGRIAGFEALLRWRHPERGEVSAERFIRVAEETGMIVPIGQWVLGEATRQMAEWRERGLAGVSMAVNLSAQEIAHPQVLERIRATLDASGLPGEALELELTESALIRDPRQVAPLLRALREMGVRVAIDDFGTGYSSLNYLREFRVDVLKIDRSFVVEIERSPRARIIPQAVVALGQALHLATVAEGVETAGQAEILRAMGCDQLQGYHFGRPREAAEVEADLVEQGLMVPRAG